MKLKQDIQSQISRALALTDCTLIDNRNRLLVLLIVVAESRSGLLTAAVLAIVGTAVRHLIQLLGCSLTKSAIATSAAYVVVGVGQLVDDVTAVSMSE